MGVENLWCLLESSGTKITIDSLATRKLAVDASLWLVQFIKAMRKPNGEMMENCHLLGLFRRICKLLFYNIKPVFVFDGPPPKLKRKTLKQRRMRREKSENDIKKMAEKLFLNRCQMASISLSKKQLKKLQKQKQKQNETNTNTNNINDTNHNHNKQIEPQSHQNNIDYSQMENGFVFDEDMAGGFFIENNENKNENNNEIDDDMAGGFFIENNNKNTKKCNDKTEMSEDESDNEMACRPLIHNNNIENENENESDIEYNIDRNLYKRLSEANQFHKFPKDISKMTAEDIAQLPASMQFEIMSKRREILRSKTRPEFFEASRNPTEYAQLQLKNFLKTSTLNRKIDETRKKIADEYNKQLMDENINNSANGNERIKGKVRRIASEGNKLFWIKETSGNKMENRYKFEWLDKQTKHKKREYYKKKRRKRNSVGYIAKTITINMDNDLYVTNKVNKGDVMFKHWSCPMCKFLNLKQRLKCDICGVVRDKALKKWKCLKCTHINEIDSSHCQLCDCINTNLYLNELNEREDNICDSNEKNRKDSIDGIDSMEIDNDLWICEVCNWKNSNLCNDCNGCNKQRPKVYNKKNKMKKCKKVKALELVIENDSESMSDGSNMEMNDVVEEYNENESENELEFSAPKLMIDLDELNECNENDIIEQNDEEMMDKESINKKYKSPQNVSPIKGLLNVKNSLNNFYNITRLNEQSQSNVLDDINNEIIENINENINEEISYESNEEINQQINDEMNEPIPENARNEINVDICGEMNEKQSNEINEQSNDEISEHESDNDIIAEMDIKPDNYIENINENENENEIPETFVFDIPTVEETEQIEKLEISKINSIESMKCLNNINEDDEKVFEISDPKQMSKGLAEINANKNRNTNTNRKRKLNDTDFHTDDQTNNKKQKLNDNIISIDRNIGLNDGQIENSLQKLYNIEDNLIEENILLSEYSTTIIRNSEHITAEMVNECHALLDMFGIPYITSPSEAEAQCAELNKLGLVDGIITDDSDVFLFGGKTIYKNLFHMNKYVEKYTNTLTESKLGLTQNKLISIAMLLGSDYTDGIKGIGPVNGIEIIQTFCSKMDSDFNGLNEFKKWIYSTEKDKQPKKKPDLNIQNYDEYIILKKLWFKYKHRNIKKKWFVEPDFPERNVIDTYLNPDVDKSEIEFECGKPDINKLKIMCREKFDWDENTINLTLEPIVKIVEHGRGAVQSSILSFADWIQPNKNIKSQRVSKAVKALIQEIELLKQIDEQKDNNDS